MYVKNLDEYLKTYGNSVVENMKKVVKPLTELKGTTDNIALKKMRLYPQQLAVVNGAQAALKKHSFVFMNEGMGTGKTIQSLSVIEGFENQNWLDRHPGANLTDCYMSKDNVAYRTIIMSPAHLVKKWASEIRNNIPYAHVYELASLDDVIAISKRPRKATQKEFYVMGKDFAKLSFMQRPAVSKIGVRPVGKFVCDCCGTEKTQRGAQVCPNCGSTRWVLEHRYVCSKCGASRVIRQDHANAVVTGLRNLCQHSLLSKLVLYVRIATILYGHISPNRNGTKRTGIHLCRRILTRCVRLTVSVMSVEITCGSQG